MKEFDQIDNVEVISRQPALIATPFTDGPVPTKGIDEVLLADERTIFVCNVETAPECEFWAPKHESVRSHLGKHSMSPRRVAQRRQNEAVQAEREKAARKIARLTAQLERSKPRPPKSVKAQIDTAVETASKENEQMNEATPPARSGTSRRIHLVPSEASQPKESPQQKESRLGKAKATWRSQRITRMAQDLIAELAEYEKDVVTLHRKATAYDRIARTMGLDPDATES